MYSICLSLLLLLIILLINIIETTNLRCHEDINGSSQLINNCRSCVIFIDTKVNTSISPREMSLHEASSVQELFIYNEKDRRRRRRRHDTKIVIHQKCAREYDGPLYGYDQTHCYCNSNRCNSNIQRCIYEIASKRYFSCYHGSNTSQNSLEIYKKCRSCRIRIDSNMIYYYECLTFGEQEQNNRTQCTCQYPMCNQDLGICQRFQQISSQPRVSSIHKVLLNSTKSISTSTTTTTITSLITNSTKFLPTFPDTNTTQTEEEISTENSTLIQVTLSSLNETQYIKTIIIQIKNHGNYFSSNFNCILNILLLFIYYM